MNETNSIAENHSLPEINNKKQEAYLVDSDNELIAMRECRVIFLGDGDSGKTYTICRIKNAGKKATSENPYVTKETPGVQIADWIVLRGKDSFNVHFWDFGGQELLHSMHRCFLTDETCYVVTVKSRETKGTQRAGYWLRNVKAFAPNSPVLLYVNCWDNDDGHRTIDEPRLRKDFPNIVDVIYVSAKEAEDDVFAASLMTPIINMATSSELGKRMVNRRWAAVRFAITQESEKHHYLTRQRYHFLCNRAGIEDENAPALLTYFNALGVCFSYHLDADNNELEDYKLLNPVWLTNAVYAIIEEGMAYAQEGQITMGSIEQMLGNRGPDRLIENGFPIGYSIKPYRRTIPEIVYTRDECAYVVDVAVAHELCYRIDKTRLFFPALCMNNTPEEALQEPTNEQRCVEYRIGFDYLPDTVVHRLMIRCLQKHYAVQACWLHGMILADTEETRIIVRMADDETLVITIWSYPAIPVYSLFLHLREEIIQVSNSLNLHLREYIEDGEDRYSIETLLAAARDNASVYGNVTGKKRSPRELLGDFYGYASLPFAKVENGVIQIPILPIKYHTCDRRSPTLRKALYHVYKGICPYCGKPINSIIDMEIDRILPHVNKPQAGLADYVQFLESRGFNTSKPDYVENYLPCHAACNRSKGGEIDNVYALLARHELAAKNAPKVLMLMDKYKKFDTV